MTAGLGRTDGGSLTVDRNALVERWVETFGLDLASPIEGALVVQEVGHVASLVDAAVADVVERIAVNLDRIAASTRESLVSTPPEHAAEVFGHRKRAEAFERSAVVVRSYAPTAEKSPSDTPPTSSATPTP